MNVSIVLITWNMGAMLEALLESIIKFTIAVTYEIIVIDNGSADNTITIIESKFPQIKLIKNAVNKGVAPARNQGLKIAQGKYIAILDADMLIEEDVLSTLFNYMEINPSVGLTGAKLIGDDRQLQFTCKRYPTPLALFARRLESIEWVKNSHVLQNHIMKEWDHSTVAEVDYVIGACQFFRRDLIDLIGYYDEEIFYGPEDLDYCIRVWRAGYKVTYNPNTFIIHLEQRITKKNIFSLISMKHILGIFYIFRKYNGRLSR